ncbi:MAG: Crp/Fnr family transcriptional regulator [Arcobacteraceae bacterium]
MKNRLKDIDMFSKVDDITLEKIYDITTVDKYEQNSIVFYEGDSSKYLHCLLKGVVKLYKTTSNDKEIILKYFHPHELIAEVASFENIPYPATALAHSSVELLKIDFEKFKQIMYNNPELSFAIQVSLIKKIKTLETVISRHIILDAKERVIEYIYDFTEDFFELKNVEIAKILNLSPETLSRVLRTLKDEKYIDMKLKSIDRDKFKRGV